MSFSRCSQGRRVLCLGRARILSCTFAAALVVTAMSAPGSAEDAIARQAVVAYAKEIGQAQMELNEGKVAEARQRLVVIDESLRGFEFDYLMARAENAEAGKPAPDLVSKLAKPEVETRHGVLNETSRQLVFICRDGTLRIHDLMAPKTPARIVTHPQEAAVWTGEFSNDGKLFFSGHQNGEVLVWDSASWELRQTISLGADWPVRELAVSPDGTTFVAESKTALELWSLAEDEPKKVTTLGERFNFGEGLAFSPVGDLVATGGMFDVLLHNAKTGEEVGSMQHASYTMGLQFSPDGKRIASAPRGNVNKFLAVFDVGERVQLFNAGPFGNYIAGMAFAPEGKRLAATGCEKKLRLFDTSSGVITLTLPRPKCGAKPAFARDGRLLGWSEPDGYRFIDLGADTSGD